MHTMDSTRMAACTFSQWGLCWSNEQRPRILPFVEPRGRRASHRPGGQTWSRARQGGRLSCAGPGMRPGSWGLARPLPASKTSLEARKAWPRDRRHPPPSPTLLPRKPSTDHRGLRKDTLCIVRSQKLHINHKYCFYQETKIFYVMKSYPHFV